MTEFPLPPMGEGLYEVELVRWIVRPGDVVRRGQSLMEVLSDKATMEVPSPFAGTIAETGPVAGTKIKVGEVILKYNGTETTTTPAPVAEVRPAPVEAALVSTTVPVAAPSVRHIARKFRIDLATVRGTGPGGRILLDDLAPLLKPPKPASANGQAKAQEQFHFDFGRPAHE